MLTLRLLARVQEANIAASATECEEALRMTAGSMDEAFSVIQRSRGSDSVSVPNYCIIIYTYM